MTRRLMRRCDRTLPSLNRSQKRKVIVALKIAAKTQDGKLFAKPATTLWPELAEAYLSQISKPIDLASMVRKAKRSTYLDLSAVKVDLDLMVDNATAYNGEESFVTSAAQAIRDFVMQRIDPDYSDPGFRAAEEESSGDESDSPGSERSTTGEDSVLRSTSAEVEIESRSTTPGRPGNIIETPLSCQILEINQVIEDGKRLLATATSLHGVRTWLNTIIDGKERLQDLGYGDESLHNLAGLLPSNFECVPGDSTRIQRNQNQILGDIAVVQGDINNLVEEKTILDQEYDKAAQEIEQYQRAIERRQVRMPGLIVRLEENTAASLQKNALLMELHSFVGTGASLSLLNSRQPSSRGE